MNTLTIRDIDADLALRLRQEATRNGRSVEEEARLAIAAHVAGRNAPADETGGAMFRRLRTAHGGGGDMHLPDRIDWQDRPLDLG